MPRKLVLSSIQVLPLLSDNCIFMFFLRYLIEHGAHVGAVNSEGELPLDVATEDAMERLLKAEIKKQGKSNKNRRIGTLRLHLYCVLPLSDS